MKNCRVLTFALLMVPACTLSSAEVPLSYAPSSLYPPPEKLIQSHGDTTYFVNPDKGDDAKAGISEGLAWKSLAKVNALKLAPGDKVVVGPGLHDASLKPSGEGTAQRPIVIQFLPGRHEFRADDAIRLCYFVSNSADAPDHMNRGRLEFS